MTPHPAPRLPFHLAATLTLLVALSACGGGGSEGDTETPASPPLAAPTYGPYGWTLKSSGPTDALRHGLSLVHPSLPDNEYVIETASEAISDTRLVMSGNVNAGQRTATALQPHALVYIYGGDVRSVSMQADGSAPLTRTKRAGSSSACRFVLVANDHATPENSRFIVSTAGADGICDTVDDGRAEARLSAASGLGYRILTGDAPLEVSRDPATLAPRGWIFPRHIELWSGGTITLVSAGSPALTSVLASTPDSALASDGTRLSVFSFGSSNAVAETPLDTATTAGTWRLIGHDASNYYVYDDNPAYTFASPWTVLRIASSNPAATQVSSGTGLITISSMGSNVLYLTVLTQTENRLVRIGKIGGARFETGYPITTKPTVQTSAGGRHQLWLVTGIGSLNVTHSIEYVDEGGNRLHLVAGGYPLSVADPEVLNFDSSESRTRFLYAQGFGARAFGDATLASYNALDGTATTLGTLPGTAEYGNDYVFASAAGGPTAYGVGFATRSSGGNYVEQSARVFSFDPNTPGSMRTTTRR